MRALILALILSPIALSAQQPQSQSPLAGLFPEQQGPAVNYVGYAFAECGPSNAPGVRVVALQGLVPEGVPKTPPRPSIELVIPGSPEALVGKELSVATKPAADGAVAMSCPVVGDCAPAQSGAVAIKSRSESGALTGEFRAKWAIGAPRAGRFTVAWRDSQAKCG